MQSTIFAPAIHRVASLPGCASIEDLAEETGVYSASPAFVRANCGPIANQILDKVPASYFDKASSLGLFPNIDVRIQRLYPNDFPAYPGWHCDGEYRADYHAQPELNVVPNHDHIIATISSVLGGVSNTVFLDQEYTFEQREEASAANPFWGMVHRDIESQPELKRRSSFDGQLISFDSMTLHKAAPAVARGWRLFFRISMWHKPYLGDGGKISRFEQIYQIEEGHGW